MSDKQPTFLATCLALAALCACAGFLLGVIRAGTHIVSTWLLLVFQVAIAIGTILFCCVIAVAVLHWSVTEMSMLRRDHAAALNGIRKRASPFITLTLLVTQVVLYLADKPFHDEVAPVAVTIVLTIVFFVANELIVHKKTGYHVLGIIVWLVGLLGLPICVWVSRGFNFRATLAPFLEFHPTYQVVFILSAISILVMPFLTDKLREST